MSEDRITKADAIASSLQPLAPAELGLLRLWIDQGARVAGAGGAPVPTRWQPMPAGFNPALAVALAPDGQTVASAVANRLRLHHVAPPQPTAFAKNCVGSRRHPGVPPAAVHRYEASRLC
jgi:hypothetical protein